MSLTAEDKSEITQIVSATVQGMLTALSPQFRSLIDQKPFQIPSESEKAELMAFTRTHLFPTAAYTDHRWLGSDKILCDNTKHQCIVTTVDTIRHKMAEQKRGMAPQPQPQPQPQPLPQGQHQGQPRHENRPQPQR